MTLFFPGWLCHFKGLFIPVLLKIHRSKIPPVTSWQLTNRRVIDIWCQSRRSICQSFFPARIYTMIEFHSGKTGLTRESLSCCTTSLILTSLTFPHWSSLCLLLTTFERLTCSKSTHDYTKQTLTLPKLPFPSTLIKLKSDNPNFFCRRLIPGDVSRSLGVIGSGSRWFSFLLSFFMFVPLYSIEGCKINKENSDQLKSTLMTPH